MLQYIVHLTHATQAVNPQEFAIGARGRRRYRRLMGKLRASGLLEEILNDASLDK
jgi:hypothetical protein